MQIHANHKGETSVRLTRTETGVLRRAAKIMHIISVNVICDGALADASDALFDVANKYGVKDEPATTAK